MTDSDPHSQLLAVILSPNRPPGVTTLSDAEGVAERIRLAEEDYVDSGAGDWLGFYDWLFNPQGELIGVQQWIDDVSTFPFSTEFMGVETDLNRQVVRIFFGQSREVEEANSASQDFGENRLLTSGASVALTFRGAGGLLKSALLLSNRAL